MMENAPGKMPVRASLPVAAVDAPSKHGMHGFFPAIDPVISFQFNAQCCCSGNDDSQEFL
jgi:hypothetical protein